MAQPETVSIGAVLSFNVPYAEVQHERTDFEHPRGGQAKYLEEPLKQMFASYERELATAWQEGLEMPAATMDERFENAKRRVKTRLLQLILDLQGKAQRKAPIEEGILRASASVEMIEEGEDLDVALERAFSSARQVVLDEFDVDLNDLSRGVIGDESVIWSR